MSGRRSAASKLRLVGDDGVTIEDADDETIGEMPRPRTESVLEYLNRPDATAEAITDGWFKTGDLATRVPDGVHPHRRGAARPT